MASTRDRSQAAVSSAQMLLDREGEFAAVEDAVALAAAGEGGTIIIEGRAGIGKSALLSAARGMAEANGFRVLTGSGGELEREFAFGVARQLFEREVLDRQGAARDELLSGAAGLAAPVLGLAPVEHPGTDPAFAALHGLYWLTDNLTSDRPLMLVVDDAHCADASSLRWLAYLCRRIGSLRCLLLIAVRSPDAWADRAAYVSIVRERASKVLSLEPLGPDAVARLIRTTVPDACERFCAVCHELARGNPMIVENVLASAKAADLPFNEAGVEQARTLGAETLSRLALDRLGTLDDDDRAIAAALAVLGASASLRRGARVAGLDVTGAAACVERLREHDLLDRVEALEFVHPLVRSAVYDRIPSHERALLHAAAARLLREEGMDCARVAAHVLASEPGALEGAVDVLQEAGRDALSRGAPEIARKLLSRAFEEPGASELKSELLHDLGQTLIAIKDPSAFVRLGEAVALTTDARVRAERALDLTRALGMAGLQEEAVETCRRAVADCADAPPEALGRLEAELSANAYSSPATQALVEPTLASLERRAESTPELGPLVLAHRAIASARRDSAVAAAALADSAFSAGLLLEVGSLAITLAVLVLIWADRLPVAQRLMKAAEMSARRSGSLHFVAHVITFRAFAHHRAGALNQALVEAEEAFRFDMQIRGTEAALPWPGVFLIDILLDRGQIDRAHEVLSTVDSHQYRDNQLAAALLQERRARLTSMAGATRDAVRQLHDTGELLVELGITNPAVSSWRSSAAILHQAIGEPDAAASLAEEELEDARRFGTDRAVGVALRHRAMIGPTVDVDMLREAVALLERSPARLEHTRALIDLGGALRRANQRRTAREPLRAALDIADECGAGALASRARHELVASGARPRRARLSGRDSLTASESRVAAHAAQGLSNAEIAQVLFVTRRTVELHLTRVYQKLGISARGELPAAIRQSDVDVPVLVDAQASTDGAGRGADADTPTGADPQPVWLAALF